MATIDTIADRSTGTTIAGKAYFETSTNQFIVYNGSTWVQLDSDGVGAVYGNRWGASFDGSDDYLAIPNTASELNFSGDMSISFWVNYTNISSGFQWLVDKSTSANDRHYSLYLRNGVGGTKLFSFSTSGGGFSTSTQSIAVNTWNHVVISCESGVAGGTKLYVNGNVETLSSTHTVVSNNSAPLQFSKRDDTLYKLEGLMDDVAIFDTALDQTAVTALRGGGTPSEVTGAVGYWRMGDDSNDSATSGGSIATITDSSGNGNDAVQATANNQPTFKALEQSATSSLSFDGGGDYLHTAGFTLGATYSFSMWFNFDAQASISNNTLLNSEHYYTDGYDSFVFRISNATTMHLYSYSGRSSAQLITITVPTLSTGTWYNLVLTNPGSGSAQGYLNGNSVTTSGSTSRAFTDLQNTKGLIIGDNLTNNNSPFDGELDEVAVFNTALSASEVSSLAASRGAHIMNDLSLSPVVYYRMGEDDSLTNGQTGISQITDASGNGKHATQSTASYQPTARVFSVIYV
jgi:hypothetical protein